MSDSIRTIQVHTRPAYAVTIGSGLQSRCGQQLRVPRGRGKISITCPKCGQQFIKKS